MQKLIIIPFICSLHFPNIYTCLLISLTDTLWYMHFLCLQNALLQDTVRRECEERYDLTEALTQAREQIMELKKRSGSFPLSQCSLSQGSLTSSAVLVNNHGQKSPNGERGMRLSGGLCDNSRASKAPAGTKYKACSNSGLPALPIPRPPSRRTSSLDESRRRITAAIIGRQLSQQWCIKCCPKTPSGTQALRPPKGYVCLRSNLQDIIGDTAVPFGPLAYF